MKNIKTTLRGCLVALLLQSTSASIYAQNTAWSTTNPIGIGTSSPTTGFKLHVNGDFRMSYSSDFIDFSRPGGENGFAFIQNTGQRADIRFNGTTLKLVTRASGIGGPPVAGNGISIKTNGFVGMGNDNPSYRLNVNDNSNSDYGAWISANSKGPALFVRRDLVGTTTGSGSYTGGGGPYNSDPLYKSYALVVEDARGFDDDIGTAYFKGQYGNGIEVSAANYSIKSTTVLTRNLTDVYGIYSESQLQGPISNRNFTVNNSYGITHQDVDFAQINSYAISGRSQSKKVAIGVFGNAYSEEAAYGVMGNAGGWYTSWAGYFSGDVKANGVYVSSDEKLKENIKDLSSSLDIVLKLSPKIYSFNQSEEFLGLNLPKGNKFGLIAQELEKVLPELVKTSFNPEIIEPNGKIISKRFEYKSVDYISLIPFLIGGIKEQQQEIEALQAQIAALMGSNVIGANTITMSGTDVGNSNSPSTLYQNNPNPFAETSVIKYQLAAEVSQAYIMIFDMSGTIIKKHEIEVKNRNGEITINAKDLKPGMYLYSLIADNKEVDTKRMILTQ